MLLRALVFYLAIFPVCADTEVIEYLIPEEVMGVYQSPYAFLILPTNDGHPVKRVNYATEVNHDKTIRKEKNIPEAAFAGIQEGSFGTGGKNQHTEGRQGAGAS